MKTPKRILLILHILGWSFASLLFLALDRRQQPSLVVITGTVLDPDSMKPLAGVEVVWKSQKAYSDKTGHYEIRVPPGVRELSFSASDRPAVRKVLIIRQPGLQVNQDVLLPNSSGTPRKVLALDRGSRLSPHGKDLESDVAADSTLSLADEYGNHDQLLTLNIGKTRVHSPIWLNANTILFGKEGVLHHRENWRLLGVFQFQTTSGRVQQVASEIGAHFLSKSPQKDALIVADQKNLHIMDSLTDPASLRRIFGLGPNQGFLLSVVWGPDDRIYFTVDDSIQLDERHYLSKSRIASIKPDGTDLKPEWASDSQYSYRYPVRGEGKEIIFCRFTLDGKEQTLWSKNTDKGSPKKVLDSALRAVYSDSKASRLYYIYQQNLHLRDLKSGADLVIVNSVKEADYLQ
ncbi:MAG: carboxypeptidase-like regulatory domain-containing protein [Acidobacteria bacterium]|nr:carboxypeptidase-like regulatory domain-containing protein [Acidobacteriota bacterium]MCI0628318.1 carboxypeptidase-like regulatory domain-containing protein [Acidobacteriota bacterium]MCI0720978.1 carboxypeptidase-like regulatory domain-containing protein [Acidobacteriota bacterium]